MGKCSPAGSASSIASMTVANDAPCSSIEAARSTIRVACALPSDLPRPQCGRGHLRVPPAVFDEFVEILAADIFNPLKVATLGLMTAGVVDFGRFTTRPGERILIL